MPLYVQYYTTHSNICQEEIYIYSQKISFLQKRKAILMDGFSFLATRNGLEPSTSSVTGWRANRLHHRAVFSLEQLRL